MEGPRHGSFRLHRLHTLFEKLSKINILRAYLLAQPTLITAGNQAGRPCAITGKSPRMNGNIHFFVYSSRCLFTETHQITGLHAGITGTLNTTADLRGGFFLRITSPCCRKYRFLSFQLLFIHADLCSFSPERLIHHASLQVALNSMRRFQSVCQSLHGIRSGHTAADEDARRLCGKSTSFLRL